MKISSFATVPKKLNALLTRRQKIYILILFVFTIFLSFIETIGIIAIMPFINMASNPAVLDEGRFRTVFDFLGFTRKSTFIVAFGILLVVFYFFRIVYNVTYTYVLSKFSLGTYKDFSLKLFKTYSLIPYKHFVQKNSSETIHIINGETYRVSQLLLHLMHLFSEVFTVLMIYGFMVIINWRMTLVLTAILAILVYLMFAVLTKKIRLQGLKSTEANIKKFRVLHEAIGNFKFIKLRCNENTFFKNFDTSAQTAVHANVTYTALNTFPRNLLENIGFSMLIGVVIFIIWQMASPEAVIPIISMYALGFYRMLPAVSRVLDNLNAIAYNQNALDIVYNAVNQETEKEGDAQLLFEKSIEINSISFRYTAGDEVLRNASIKINKGESIAITGESGAGKSTLVDILIGINKPNSGSLYIDDVKVTSENIRSWRRKIGYIPQSIYLFDGTVAENVVFSSEFDEARLIKVLKMANIWSFLEKKDGIHTLVGERGIQLSGGQKQRVGIARALYTDPEVLVLDEATSSLDDATQAEIMDEIYDLGGNKTLVIIAHRLSTLERCNRQILIENGVINESTVNIN